MSTDASAPAPQLPVESSEPKVVEAFANDPVAPEKTLSEQPATTEMASQESSAQPKVEAFANDPVSPETSAATEETKPAAEAVTHGVLGYKAPGLLSHLRFSSRYFWLGDDAIPAADLKQYLQSEKSDSANHTAAWSSQSGKGLLYFVKREEDKKTPAGVINLSEISELSKGTSNDFSFKLHGKEHAFQAINAATRDAWYSSIESTSQHAVGLKEDMVSSGGYKETLSTLAAPAGIAAAGVAAVAGTAGAVAASSSSKKSNEGLSESAAKSKSKDRSVSRNKRASIFGGILGKKDEEKPAEEKPAEEKKEEAVEAKEDADKEAEKADADKEAAAAAEKKEEAKKEELKKEKAAKEQAEKDKKAQEKKAAAAKKEQEKKDKAAKEQAEKEKKAADKKAAEAKKEQERKDKEQQKALAKAQKEHEEKEAAAKDAEAKAEAKKAEEAEAESKKKELELAGAGVGAAAVAGVGVAAVAVSNDDSEKPATEALADKTNTESPSGTETSKTAKSTKRNSIFGFFQKSSTPASEAKDEEAAPAVPPKDEARNLAVAEADNTETPATAEHAVNGSAVNGTAVNGTAVNGAAVNGAVNGIHKPTTTEAAKTETTTTEKRRSSFFGLGSIKKEKEAKSEPATNGEAVAPVAAAVPAVATATDGTNEAAAPTTVANATKQKQPSKLSEFIRRPSQLIKSKQNAQKDKTNSTAPATVAEAEGKDDGVKVNGATGIDEKTEEVLETAKVEPVNGDATEEKKVIGDVVPEAVSVGNTQDGISSQLPTAPVVTASA